MKANLSDPRWQAVVSRSRADDGSFFFAVRTTGVYCKPSCPSRRPKLENVQFFDSPDAAEAAGFRACKRCAPRISGDSRTELVNDVSTYIRAHFDEPVTLGALSEWTGVSPYHLQRTFKEATGLTPRQFAESVRLQAFKGLAQRGGSVGQAQTEAGFGSSSRLYEKSSETLGMTPATYGRYGKGATIRFAVAESALGPVLVARTECGLCAVRLGESADRLEKELRSEFAEAAISEDPHGLAHETEAVLTLAAGQPGVSELPLDVQGTAFQQRVWAALRSIPRGEVRSYSQVAEALGEPTAVRAVAGACASNPVALATPCHRVVRSDGALSGYRWGIDKKKRLLQEETS